MNSQRRVVYVMPSYRTIRREQGEEPGQRASNPDWWLEGVVQADGTVLGSDGVKYMLKAMERKAFPPGLTVCFVPRWGKWGGTEWAIRAWPKDPDWQPDCPNA